MNQLAGSFNYLLWPILIATSFMSQRSANINFFINENDVIVVHYKRWHAKTRQT